MYGVKNMVLLKCFCKRNYFRYSYRAFSINSTTLYEDVKSTINKSKKNLSNIIYKYLQEFNAESLFKMIPVDYLQSKTANKYILINPIIAKKISKTLKSYLDQKYVLESDPGLGLLTKELVQYVSKLKLYEEDVHLRSYLRKLQDENPDKIDIFNSTLQKIHRIQKQDHKDNGIRMALLFHGIPTDVVINILVISPCKKFIAEWINHLLYEEYFSKFTQLEFYFFISPSVYTRLTATPHNDYSTRQQQFSVLAQLMFDIELVLNDIPRKAFLPWPVQKRKKKQRDIDKYENDYELMYLVKMSVQWEYLKYIKDEELYRCFLSFVSEALHGKKRIIPYFESMIPGCGSRIILQGYNIYSIFRDLTPVEMFSLFLDFSTWPEFKNTTFYTHCKNYDLYHQDDEQPVNSSLSEFQIDDDFEIDEDDNDDDTFIPGNDTR